MSGDKEGLVRVPVRAALADVEPYGAPQLDVPVALNTNETPEPPPSVFGEMLAARISQLPLHRYPDRDHVALRTALARRHGLDASRVWAANGSNEVLLQLLQTYGGTDRCAVAFRPSYSMYPELCRTAMTDVVEVDLDGNYAFNDAVIEQVAATDPALILVASPNNPVGAVVTHDTVRALHNQTNALVIVDEAYVEFAHDASMLSLIDELDRLVIVRTFSKAFRLAGLRLGYVVGAPWVVEDIQKVRLPYHLSTITQVAGEIALEHEDAFLAHRALVATERARVAAAASQLAGVVVFPSAANFLLMRVDVDRVFERLLDRGVLVRDFSRRPRLEGCIRVTIGTPNENDAFLVALGDVVTQDT